MQRPNEKESEIRRIIRDPVHQYISIYGDEFDLIDFPLLQRLRHIKQNAMTYLTYPAAVGSRFEHSLGTMHLASKMLTSALEKSDEKVKEEFLAQCKIQFSELAKEQKLPFDITNINIERKIFRILRLASLLHDIGTPPFSHALEELVQKNVDEIYTSEEVIEWQGYQTQCEGAFHEFLATKIIEEDKTIGEVLGEDKEFILRVLLARPEEKTVFKTLLEIISFDVDADRCDYLIRDARTSGSDFGQFDLERLIESFRLHKVVCEKEGEREEYFVIRPTIKALSAIENLFVQRYQAYRWVSFHHRVVSSNAILKEIIWRLMEARLDGKKPFADLPLFLRHKTGIKEENFEGQDNAVFLDDIYIMNLLREAYRMTLKSLKTGDYGDYPERQHFEEMRLLLEEILFRKKRGISLWKDAQSFTDFDDIIRPQIEDISYRDQKSRYHRSTGRDLPPEDLKKIGPRVLNWVADNYLVSFKNLKDLEAKINKKLRENRLNGFILLSVTFFKPFEYRRGKEYDLITRENGLRHISHASELVRQLKAAKEKDMLLQAYLILHEDIWSSIKEQRREILEKAKLAFRKGLIEWLADYLKGG